MKVTSLLKNGIAGVLLSFALTPMPAGAVDWGPYATGGEGQLKNNGKLDYTGYGGGLQLQSTPETDEVFNYRLQLGYERISYDIPGASKAKNDRFDMIHTFALGFVRTETVRLWLAPQIGLYYEQPAESGGDFHRIGGNIGPALGLDIHLGSAVTLAISAFGRYGIFSDSSGNTELSNAKKDGTEWEAGANLALLF